MDATLLDRIKNTSAARKSREENKNFVLAHPEMLSDLIRYAFDSTDKDAHKACWILEFVSIQHIGWLQPYLDFICNSFGNLKDESAIRPIAKICQLLVIAHFRKDSTIRLSEDHMQKITEACFDWLINDVKVAPKAYSMRALFLLGRHFDWIPPELQIILGQNYHQQSAAYKAAAKEILKKLT